MHLRTKTILAALALLTLLALAACQPGTPATPTLGNPEGTSTVAVPTERPTEAQPTSTSSGQTAVPTVPGYPAEGQTIPTVDSANGGYPAPGDGPSGVPAMDNLSTVKATLLEISSDPDVPGFTRLSVKILESAAAQGMASRTDDLIGEQIFLFADPAQLPTLQAGDTITAEVSFRGDERGGRYYASKIEK